MFLNHIQNSLSARDLSTKVVENTSGLIRQRDDWAYVNKTHFSKFHSSIIFLFGSHTFEVCLSTIRKSADSEIIEAWI